tara:strand:+ start:188 stop:424 length:237 start_codon:yes stop_codon:yes gene_type:complete
MASMARPYKGKRVPILAKPLEPLAEVIKRNADATGLSYGEYITALAAQQLGMPEYAPQPPRNRAEELDFPQEADTAAA